MTRGNATRPPTRCPYGHPLAGLTVVITRQDCSCPATRKAGRHTVHKCTACASNGLDMAWYDPPHTPAAGEGDLPVQVLGAWRCTGWTSGTRLALLELPRCAPPRPLVPAHTEASGWAGAHRPIPGPAGMGRAGLACPYVCRRD